MRLTDGFGLMPLLVPEYIRYMLSNFNIYFVAAQARQGQCGGDQCMLTHAVHKYDLRRKNSQLISEECATGSSCAILPPKRVRKTRISGPTLTKGM